MEDAGPAAAAAAPTNLDAFAESLVWSSFSYSGWNAAIYMSSEIRDASRTTRVRGLLIAYGYGFPVATTVTEAERQPVEVDVTLSPVPVGQRHCVQGAPTSPGICNALLLRVDRRFGVYARKHKLNYTRYAADLSFSDEMDRCRANKVRVVISRALPRIGRRAEAHSPRAR